VESADFEAKDLEKTFGTTRALNGFSLSCEPGEILGLVGPNGAGKSTFIRCLLGLYQPTGGELRVFKSPKEFRQLTGYVPEVYSLYPFLSGREFLTLISQLLGIDRSTIADRRDRCAGILGLHELDRAIGTYSKGMKQQLLLTTALMNDPNFLILDEPFSGLDPTARERFTNFLTEFVSPKKAILLSIHNLDTAARLCSRIAFIKEGKMVGELKKEEVENISECYAKLVEGKS
jgi:ABC-2 type transport system ATP-binding protein